jgi:sodium/potassium-transporting ATPase subunit alpha
MRKMILYLLISNFAQTLPIIAAVIFAFPNPLSNILNMVICVSSDILPAISFSYEHSEKDLLKREFKNKKISDSIFSHRLIFTAYGIMGWMAAAAGFLAYFCSNYSYFFLISFTKF